MAWPTIDPTAPAGTDKKKFGDDAIRTTKQHVIDGLQQISNYSTAGVTPALKTAMWTTLTRPSGPNLVDRVTGYNTDLNIEEYYDLATTTWIPKGVPASGFNMTGAINEAKSNDIASAAITDIGAATGNYVVITGTTNITNFGTVQAGTKRTVKFNSALMLTYNITSLILPGGSNIITAAGDTADFISLGSGNWLCTNYQRADNLSTAIAAGVIGTKLAMLTGTIPHGGTIPVPDGYTQTQCVWMVSVNDDNVNNSTWDINEGGAYLQYKYRCYADSNRVVTCQAYGYPRGWVNGIANYIIIGIR